MMIKKLESKGFHAIREPGISAASQCRDAFWRSQETRRNILDELGIGMGQACFSYPQETSTKKVWESTKILSEDRIDQADS